LNYAIHMAALAQIRHLDSEGRAYYDRKIAEKASHRALRFVRSSDASATPSTASSSSTPNDARHNGPGEGTQGTTHSQRGRLSP
jgi:hypothetical protein